MSLLGDLVDFVSLVLIMMFLMFCWGALVAFWLVVVCRLHGLRFCGFVFCLGGVSDVGLDFMLWFIGLRRWVAVGVSGFVGDVAICTSGYSWFACGGVCGWWFPGFFAGGYAGLLILRVVC